MAKNVEWIKITTDMFDNRKIKHLRKLPEGNNIVLIWVMLLTMAGRCNAGGMIFLTENIPYTIKMLADELDFEESTIRLALEALEHFEMVVRDEEAFYIPGWQDHQNVDGMDRIREQNRIRQQKRRERQALDAPREKKEAEERREEAVEEAAVEIPEENAAEEPEKPMDPEGMPGECDKKEESGAVRRDSSRDSHVTVTQSHAPRNKNIEIENKNREIEKEKNKKEKGRRASELEYPPGDARLQIALEDFVEYRKKIKKPVTQRALDLLVKKLLEMSDNDAERVKILEQSIMQGWIGIFPLKAEAAAEQNEDRENKWRRFARNDGGRLWNDNGKTGKRIWERTPSEGSGSV